MEITIALPKGRLAEMLNKIFEKMGFNFNEDMKNTRNLVLKDEENLITCFLVKPSDVLIYVENGVADIGIAGKDVVLENNKSVKVICDLEFGKCKISVAGIKGKTINYSSEIIKVATKYPNITKDYFDKKNQKIEILKLNGSVELAPLLGLSEVIVDIVETGSTLKSNGLEVFEDIFEVNAQIILNPKSYILKEERIKQLVANIKTNSIGI